jgi:hypothetical protein
LLDAVPEEHRDRFWYYRRSRAFELQGQTDSARQVIDAVIANGPDDKYASSMYEYRGELKRRMGEVGWDADFVRAIELASNEKYRKEFELKRKT